MFIEENLFVSIMSNVLGHFIKPLSNLVLPVTLTSNIIDYQCKEKNCHYKVFHVRWSKDILLSFDNEQKFQR